MVRAALLASILVLAGCASVSDIDTSQLEPACAQACTARYSECLGKFTLFPIQAQHQCTDAMHLCAPSPQRTPVLYQAGASARGRRFAATHAECVFVNGQKKEGVREIVGDIRNQAVRLGRRADDIAGAALFLASPAAHYVHGVVLPVDGGYLAR